MYITKPMIISSEQQVDIRSLFRSALSLRTQQAHNIKQRRIDVNATSWRRIDVDTVLFRCRVPAWDRLARLPNEKNKKNKNKGNMLICAKAVQIRVS